jgi:hypothetical protein
VRVDVGARNLKNGNVEMKLRTEAKSVLIPTGDAPKIIAAKVQELYDSLK